MRLSPSLRPWVLVVLGGLPSLAGVEVLESDLASAPPMFRVLFSYSRHPELGLDAATPISSVHVAGQFNAWSTDAMAMRDEDRDGQWSAELWLPEGRYEYKFVINGNVWTDDPRNAERVGNDYGSWNSVLRLGAYAAAGNALRHDDVVHATAVTHVSTSPEYVAPTGSDGVRLRVRTERGDVDGATLLVYGDTPATATSVTRIAMQREADDGLFEYYTALATLNEDKLLYRFELGVDPPLLHYDAGGPRALTAGEPPPQPHWALFRLSRRAIPRLDTPEWAKHAVWYQILPERFRNGEIANDYVHTATWTHDWYEPLPWEREVYPARDPGKESKFYHVVYGRKYGGDLQGVRQKLLYLRELGVTAIYLMPVFESPSLHKYDTADYRHIDQHYTVIRDATEEALVARESMDPATWHWTRGDRVFLDLVEEIHAHGMKVIIDGVFNHVGDSFWAFRDVRERGPESPYSSWFKITSWNPFQYVGWAGFGGLPEIAQHDGDLTPEFKQHILDITRRWMDPNGDLDPSDGVDGWRLDVPTLVGRRFWEDWRALVREINPQAYVSGEIWERASDWVGERGPFDAVMNYEWTKRVYRFFIDTRSPLPPSAFDRALHELTGWYPWETLLTMQNLLDSHDTDRVVSAIANPNRPFDQANRLQDNGPDYNPAKPTADAYRILKQIVAFQMTFAGAPMIWYGDEAGMWGADDPSCRKPMLWKDLEPYDAPEENFVMEDVLRRYQTLVAVRNRFEALRVGVWETALVDDREQLYGYWRRIPNQSLLVVLNRSGEDRTAVVAVPAGLPRQWKRIDLETAERTRGVVAGLPGEHAVYVYRPEQLETFETERGRVTIPVAARDAALLVAVE